MKRLAILLFLCVGTLTCKDDASQQPAKAEEPAWTAQLAVVESVGKNGLDLKLPGSDEFAPLRESQPIPGGSVVKTPPDVRATLRLGDDLVTLNHSTTLGLESGKLDLRSGQLVLEHQGGTAITVVTPNGEALVHEGAPGKIAIFAGERESTITVTQGVVEVRHKGEAFEGRPGQEILLPAGTAPSVSTATDLARQFDWSELSMPDAASEEVPRGLGKLVGKTPGGETEHKLGLVSHQVSVKIQGNIAYTEITEIFENPTSQTLEGVYRFPLPSDAQISRLALRVGNRLMEGEFLETAHAERIWRDVIDQWRDPAMLKWKEGNMFELRIFPIDPRQKREVTIGYIQRLDPTARGYRYSYPLPVDHAALIPANEFKFEASLYGHDPTMSLEVLGYPASVQHGATEADQPVTRVTFAKNDFVASGDLGITFNRRAETKMQTYGFVEPDGQGYALFTVRPELPAVEEVRPRDFVVVLDTSSSRRGIAMDVQRRLTARLIREMDPLDRVAVVTCSHTCKPVGEPGFRAPRAATADEVASLLLDVKPEGATYPVEAMRVASELLRRRTEKARDAHVVWFTDGIASAGELRPGPMGEAVGRLLTGLGARTSIVDVGGDRDDANLEALARGTNGRVVTLDPNLSTTGQALAILSEHYRPLLSDLAVEAPDGVTIDTLLPPALASGEELVVAARFDGTPSGELRLRGRIGDAPFQSAYEVALDRRSPKGNAFVPREWATHRIRALEMMGLDAGDPKNLIVGLSKKFGVLSRYTTLLALESKEMMDEFGVRERRRTEFSGDEMAEAAADEDPPAELASGRGKPTTTRSAPKPQMKSARPTSAPMPVLGESADARESTVPMRPRPQDSKAERKKDSSPKKKMVLDDDLNSWFDNDGPPRRPPRRHYRRRRVKTVQTRDARPTTSWEDDNIARKRKAHLDDPTNRSKRMALIRAQMRAGRLTAARQGTQDWLALNPMDPEAIVQMAQIDAASGDVDAFYRNLVSAADAAPRGKWLVERIHHAADAHGDEALACAYKVSLEGVSKKAPRVPSDILACPMTTNIGEWFGGTAAQPSPPAPVDKLSGKVVVTLNAADGADWDLALVEPTGRLLWWGSARQNLKTTGVRGGTQETLALPSVRSGTYSVLAIPSRAGASRTTLTVTVRADGRTKTYTKGASGPVELAEFELK